MRIQETLTGSKRAGSPRQGRYILGRLTGQTRRGPRAECPSFRSELSTPMRRNCSLLPSRLSVLALALCLPLAGCTRGYGQPEQPSSQLAFGVNMAQNGLWSEALFRFHQAERLDPDNPHVINNLGVAYEASGNFEAALQQYQKALRLAPDNREVRANYARFVEFYQSFRPKGKDGKPLPAPAPAAARSGQPAAPTAPAVPIEPAAPAEPADAPPPVHVPRTPA